MGKGDQKVLFDFQGVGDFFSLYSVTLSEIHRKGKGAVKMCMNVLKVLKMFISCKHKCDQNLYELCRMCIVPFRKLK